MKIEKSTKILINLVFILVIALLVKSLITVPRDLYAKEKTEYKVVSKNYEEQKIIKDLGEKFDKMQADLPLMELVSQIFERALNKNAKDGWRLHSYVTSEAGGQELLIFER